MQRQIYSILSAGILCIFSIAVSNILPTITKNNASSKLLAPCQVIVNSSDRVVQADWSPDGKRIVFTTQSDVGDREQRVSIINADGTGFKALAAYNLQKMVGTRFMPQAPTWLSDNLHIVFRLLEQQQSEAGEWYSAQYIIIDSDLLTSDIILNTSASVMNSHSGPVTTFDLDAPFSVSPNNQFLAFFNRYKLNFISLNSKNTNNFALLPFGSIQSMYFSWSPDSHYLIVADGTLRLIDVNASFNLVDLRLPATGKAVWLRDGSKIAYVNDGIYITNPSGSDPQQVTSYQDKTVVRIDSNLGWLANGTEIGFISQRNQDTELYAVDVQDHIERQITYGNSSNLPLTTAWSPDGERVAFPFLNTLQFAFTNTSCQIVGT